MANVSTGPSILPSELWLEILSAVVAVPGLFDTKWAYPPTEAIWEGAWATESTPHDSLRMRRNLIRVSREWCNLGRRFLFEDLVVDKRDKAQALAALFEQTAGLGSAGAADAPFGYGRWVKRVTIRNDIWFTEDAFPDLERLLQHCVNVQILFINTDITDLSLLSRLIQPRFTRSLRRISIPRLPNRGTLPSHIFENSDPSLGLDWVAFPSNWLLRMFANTHESFTPVSLRNLSVLDITLRSNVTTLPTWSLPALRYLSLTNISDHDIPSLLPFMAINGGKLLGLSLGTARRCDIWYKFLEYTPILAQIVVDDHDMETLRPPGSPTYPSITQIGLVTISYVRASDVRRIQEGLAYTLGHNLFPNLRSVRILADAIPDTLTDDWAIAVDTATKYGIRLEDRNRSLLGEKLPSAE